MRNVSGKRYTFLAGIADDSGQVPQVGDCDDGRVELLDGDLDQMVDLSPEEQNSLRIPGQLGIGSRLLRGRFGGRDSEANWYEAPRETMRRLRATGTSVHVFDAGGMAIARRGATRVWFFALPNGISGKGSHTHNDKFECSRTTARDGTFNGCWNVLLHADPISRNLFRSTASHNTVVVDRKEQNRFSAADEMLFRMENDAVVSPIDVHETISSTRMQAEHQGYERLGVTHKRIVYLEDAQIIIEDALTGNGEHEVVANWHFPSD